MSLLASGLDNLFSKSQTSHHGGLIACNGAILPQHANHHRGLQVRSNRQDMQIAEVLTAQLRMRQEILEVASENI